MESRPPGLVTTPPETSKAAHEFMRGWDRPSDAKVPSCSFGIKTDSSGTEARLTDGGLAED
jgi:hypothetical protein